MARQAALALLACASAPAEVPWLQACPPVLREGAGGGSAGGASILQAKAAALAPREAR